MRPQELRGLQDRITGLSCRTVSTSPLAFNNKPSPTAYLLTKGTRLCTSLFNKLAAGMAVDKPLAEQNKPQGADQKL
jgi:hypothetical protein